MECTILWTKMRSSPALVLLDWISNKMQPPHCILMTSMHLPTIAAALLLHREGTENYLLFGLSQQNHMLVRRGGENVYIYLQFIHKYSRSLEWCSFEPPKKERCSDEHCSKQRCSNDHNPKEMLYHSFSAWKRSQNEILLTSLMMSYNWRTEQIKGALSQELVYSILEFKALY